jgi:GNAT superfamily N-acetyltransferase
MDQLDTQTSVDWVRDGYVISTDRARVDRQAVWRFLRESYWSPGVSFEVVDRAIDNSLMFGMLSPDGRQAGFARAVTDCARFAWIGDLFVLPEHRGSGLGVWLAQTIFEHPQLRDLRVILATDDAHELYARFGFRPVDAQRMMERPAGARQSD